jgi:hypothetical protein
MLVFVLPPVLHKLDLKKALAGTMVKNREKRQLGEGLISLFGERLGRRS